MKKLINFVLDFIFPQFCVGCKKEVSIFCDECKTNLQYLPTNKNPWDDYCHLYFDACYVCLDYNGPISKLIHNYKYNYLENISDILADFLAYQLKKINMSDKYIITNIPLHKHKKRQRGFDQTEILAKKLSNKINMPYIKLLSRTKKTKSQARLSKKERIQNTNNAFEYLNNAKIDKNKTILLIDDVVTTGFTLAEAAKTLKLAGFKKIKCLVLAKN